MLESLSTLWYFLLIMIGFGVVVFWHELGHFLAARWAGIRVHSFAVGFGSAIVSYRKGFGFTRGSSEKRYKELLAAKHDAGGDATDRISPTEYRLNWFPLGGYVKMLGQEDLDPAARSDAPDSYNNKPVWKRMVVISAGVVMNIVLGAILFLAVFMAGKPEPPAVTGYIVPGMAAAEAGLAPGLVIEEINGEPVSVFNELQIKSALSKRGTELNLRVREVGEDGEETTRVISVVPTMQESGLQALGIVPAASTTLWDSPRPSQTKLIDDRLRASGLGGVPRGSRLTAINGRPPLAATVLDGQSVPLAHSLRTALTGSGRSGSADATFETPEGGTVEVTVFARPELTLEAGDDAEQIGQLPLQHLLGVSPLMSVESTTDNGARAGLEPGDVFLRIGEVFLPSVEQGIRTIRSSKGQPIPVTVLRGGEPVTLSAPVDVEGRIGFAPGRAFDQPFVTRADPQRVSTRQPAGELLLPAGRIVSINGESASSFTDLYRTLRFDAADTVEIAVVPISAIESVDRFFADAPEAQTLTIELDDTQREIIAALNWDAEPVISAFAPAVATLKADNPIEAAGMALDATKRWLERTYITFIRLAQGSVGARSLRGPVGIAHLGVQVAEQGFIELLFLLGLLSVNLAVINFLPLPILDGGQFVLLSIEGLMRRPVPVIVQNLLTLAGLALIAVIFVFVTSNDLQRLITGTL